MFLLANLTFQNLHLPRGAIPGLLHFSFTCLSEKDVNGRKFICLKSYFCVFTSVPKGLVIGRRLEDVELPNMV